MAMNTVTSDDGLDYFGGPLRPTATPSGVFTQPGAPAGTMTNSAMLGQYQQLLANGVTPEDAINQVVAANNGSAQGSGPVPQATSTSTADAVAALRGGTGSSGSGGGVGGSAAPGGGITNPALYTPFTGTAPGPPAAASWSDYAPNYLPQPTVPQAPAFSYADYALPSLQDAENQPGYQFGVQQGEKALQQSRASQGLLRTGGTLKDILDYGRNAATQNYGNVVAQTEGAYDRNRAGAVQSYNTNYQTQFRDPYLASVAATNQTNADRFAQATTAIGQTNRNNDNSYNAAWQQYLNSEDTFYNNQNAPFSKYLSLAQLGAANA